MNKKPKILVVDDETFYVDVLENLMRGEYEVASVSSGELAIEYIEQNPHPDLILLDVIMPGIDGYEVCKRIKSKPITQHIPIIFLTVKSDVDDEVRGFNLGGVDYITKPMSPPIVLARVRTHVNLSNITRQLKNLVEQLKL